MGTLSGCSRRSAAATRSVEVILTILLHPQISQIIQQLHQLVRSPHRQGRDLSSLRVIVSGAEFWRDAKASARRARGETHRPLPLPVLRVGSIPDLSRWR